MTLAAVLIWSRAMAVSSLAILARWLLFAILAFPFSLGFLAGGVVLAFTTGYRKLTS